MAGHSHWAGIKHKKGKADKQRSKIFSKLSKEEVLLTDLCRRKLKDSDNKVTVRCKTGGQPIILKKNHKAPEKD